MIFFIKVHFRSTEMATLFKLTYYKLDCNKLKIEEKTFCKIKILFNSNIKLTLSHVNII